MIVVLAAAVFGVAYVLLRTDVSSFEALPDTTLVRLVDIGSEGGPNPLPFVPAANDVLRNAALLASATIAIGVLAVGFALRAHHRWGALVLAGVALVLAIVAPSFVVDQAYEAMADDDVTVGLHCTTYPAPTTAPLPQRLALCNLPHESPTPDGTAPTSVNVASYRIGAEGPQHEFDRVVPLLGPPLGATASISAVELRYGDGRVTVLDGGGVQVFDLFGEPSWQRPMDPATFDPTQSGGAGTVAELSASLDVGPAVLGLDPAVIVVHLNCEHDSQVHDDGEPESYLILDVRDGHQLNTATCP